MGRGIIVPLILNMELDGCELSVSRHGALPSGKSPRYAFNERLDGPQSPNNIR